MRALVYLLAALVILALAIVGVHYVRQLSAPSGAIAAVDLIRVDKSGRRMELVGAGRVIRSYRISLGSSPRGHKQKEGDSRTPEGRYRIDWRNPRSKFHKSLHISYPNAQDKQAARKRGVSPGGDIMIHGMPNGWGWAAPFLSLWDWTDGCIAVNDGEMDEIWALVKDGTPVVILP